MSRFLLRVTSVGVGAVAALVVYAGVFNLIGLLFAKPTNLDESLRLEGISWTFAFWGLLLVPPFGGWAGWFMSGRLLR